MKKLIYLCLTLSVVGLNCGEADLTAPSPNSDRLVGGELFKTSRFRATSAEFEVSLFAFGFNRPQGMAFDQRDGLFVADQGTGEIKVVIPGNNSGVPPLPSDLTAP